MTDDPTPQEAALADAMHEIARLRALVELLREENRLLRQANATFGRPWQAREGERE
ncbi:MAG TPA: hypothetical protein VFT99_03920 [Roseiflexaceae bacterium]|nr:hypothetical protein [Roseiflexaceae bacterium]